MKLYNAMEESYLKENLIHKWVTNIVRQNDGYEFLFDDEVYLPVHVPGNCLCEICDMPGEKHMETL